MQKEVRAQDSVFVIVSVALNPRGRDMTWEFFKSNSDRLLEQYDVSISCELYLFYQRLNLFFFNFEFTGRISDGSTRKISN